MYFAPHILHKKQATDVVADEYGRYSEVEGNEELLRLCPCRCDDNSIKEFHTDNGQVYRPSYHVVGQGTLNVECGDEIVITNAKDGSTRATGRVYNIQRTNVLGYWELWV